MRQQDIAASFARKFGLDAAWYEHDQRARMTTVHATCDGRHATALADPEKRSLADVMLELVDKLRGPGPIDLLPREKAWTPYPWPYGQSRDYYDREV